MLTWEQWIFKKYFFIYIFCFSSNIYENVREALPKDYKPEYVSAEFTTLCNDVINIHPHIESKTAADEIKKVTGEINPETLPEPQRQSSALSSSFNTGLDGLDTSSTNPAQHSRRRRDIPNAKSTRTKRQLDPNAPSSNPAVYILPNDGVYLLVVYVGATSNTQTYTANVHVEVGTHFNNQQNRIIFIFLFFDIKSYI